MNRVLVLRVMNVVYQSNAGSHLKNEMSLVVSGEFLHRHLFLHNVRGFAASQSQKNLDMLASEGTKSLQSVQEHEKYIIYTV